MARHPVKAYGRALVYGSSRYTTEGAKHPSKGKTFGSRMVGAYAGSAIGGFAASATTHGHPYGFAAGSVAGGFIGAHAGKRFAAHRGWVRRDKQRITLRAAHSQHFKPDRRF